MVYILMASTSTVKYTTPLPYIGLSESSSNLYTISFLCKSNHRNLKTHWYAKPSNLGCQTNFKKSLHILDDSASSVQVDILNTYMSRMCLKHNRITLIDVLLQTNIGMVPSSL